MRNMFSGFFFILAAILSSVRWNPINGKLPGLMMLLVAGKMAYTCYQYDNETFVLRGWYVYVGLMVTAALHIMFNANPLIKPKEDKKKK